MLQGLEASNHVLESDDFFSVFEWGAGGIVHIHLLRWMAGRGRYDHESGAVPSQRRRRGACDLAAGHMTELAEWDLQCPERFKQQDWDEDVPVRRDGEPLSTDAESDGSGSDSECTAGEDDPLAEATRLLGHDEQWIRLPGGIRSRCSDGHPIKEEVPPVDVEHLKALDALLRDPSWHPAAIPLDAKRCLLTYNSRRTRRLRRWFLTRLLDKTNQHDRHGGGPIDVPPVYGDDTASEDESSSGGASADVSESDPVAQVAVSSACDETARVRILSWNTNAAARMQSDCTFLLTALHATDATCLQEVTPGAVEWISKQLDHRYRVLGPQECCGRAWPHEGHDVAIVVDTERFQVMAHEVVALDSGQQRCVFAVTLTCRRTSAVIVVATTHLESGDCRAAPPRTSNHPAHFPVVVSERTGDGGAHASSNRV